MVDFTRHPGELELTKSAVESLDQMSWLQPADKLSVDLIMMYCHRIDELAVSYYEGNVTESNYNNGLHQAVTKLNNLLDRVGGSTRARENLDTAVEGKVSAVDELKSRRMKRTGTE